LGINNVDFDAIGQLLITVCMCQILEKKLEYTEAVAYPEIFFGRGGFNNFS
jgi:hypothetical protein